MTAIAEPTVTCTETIRLNIGAGDTVIPGFTPIDRKFGQEAFPLLYPDASVEEIRASHVLEHFNFGEALEALRDWVRVLKPGGKIRLAVPDFDKIDKTDPLWPFYVMGGQTDSNDYHKCLFDEERLRYYMEQAGLERIQRWHSSNTDCAALPCSLNLEGYKPQSASPKSINVRIRALIGLPRVGWNDSWLTISETLHPFGIPVQTFTGCFWGQNLERGFEEALKDELDWVLTFDYDTMCTRKHLEMMLDTFARRPDIDALAAFQMRRGVEFPLMGITGKTEAQADAGPVKVDTAHFGMTLLRVAALKEMQKPWLHAVPAPDGSWGHGRRDDDIAFWDKWRAAGNTIYVDTRVRIGHLELVVSEYDEDFQPRHVHIGKWWDEQQTNRKQIPI